MFDAAQSEPTGQADAEPDTYVLPEPLPPEPGESLASLVLRNAEPYRFRRSIRLLKRLRPKAYGLAGLSYTDPSTEFGQRLSRFLGITRPQLSCMTYGTADPKVCTLLGQSIHHDFVSLDHRRYCPLCMAEGPYHRAIWDLSVLTACPAHGVRLVGTCSRGHHVNWQTDRVSRCVRIDCRAELRETPVERVPDDELVGVRGMGNWFEGTSPDRFAPLSLGDAVRACFHLGAIARGHHYSPRPVRFANNDPDETVRVMNAGWSVLSDWPRGFHSLLEQLRDGADARGGRYGVNKEFGFLPKFLWTVSEEPFGKTLGAEFSRYVAQQVDLATRAHEVADLRMAEDLRHQRLSATEAMKLLGVRFETMVDLAEQHDLYLVPPTGTGAPALLRANRVYALAQQRAALLTKEDVRELLGSGKATVDKLREAGLLPIEPPDGPDRTLYPLAGVEALLEDLENRVKAADKKPKHTVTMATIARQVSLPDFDVCDIVLAIRAGKLTPVAIDSEARGLHRVLFRQADVDRFVAEIACVPGRSLSVVEAAAELGVKQEVAYHWVRTGLLATITVDSPTETGRRVTEAALTAFRREYVTAAEFARVHRLGKEWAGRNLIEFGVKAVSGPSVDGARQFLLRRSDLEGFDVSKLVSGQSKLQGQAASKRRLTRAGAEEFKHKVGKALEREFGPGLIRHYHFYRDEITGVAIQVMTASNIGVAGTYKFLFTEKHLADLGAAARAYVALAFADRLDFLLVPWGAIAPLIPTMRRYQTRTGPYWELWIRADGQGNLAPFGEHVRNLAGEQSEVAA